MEQERTNPPWLFDEADQPGVDYMDLETARRYDERHQRFRNFEAEFLRIDGRVRFKPTDVVLDLGCGTGAFSIEAAKRCKRVYAVDISETMLTLLREKIARRNQTNVEIIQGGFLTYRHNAEPLDVVVSSLALHHLPDFWKAVALKNIADSLKPGGVFYLFDVIFHFPIADWKENVETIAGEMSRSAGKEAFTHIQKEFSSFDWILEGMFDRTGFDVEAVFDDLSFTRAYLCRKRL